jgi:hypothetical protein
MPDKKISQLTAASTPLVGTEVAPIVQSNATVKATVDSFTSGRALTPLSVTQNGKSVPYSIYLLAALSEIMVLLVQLPQPM